MPASPYCTTYLNNAHPWVEPATVTSYTSVRPTVFNVAGSSLVTRKDAPYTPLDWEPDKRDLKTAPESMITPTPVIEARQAALPAFASFCTGDVNRLSSACTCLIGQTDTTPTKTIARTIPGAFVTQSVCDPDTLAYDWQYGLRDQSNGGYQFRHNHGQIGGVRYSNILDIPGCCKQCFHTPKCVAYHLDPVSSECEIDLLIGSNQPTPQDNLCPFGLQFFYDPYQSGFNNSYALGLCSYMVPSDE